MDVVLYVTTSPPNKVNKKLTNKKNISGVKFTEDDSMDILNPTLIFKMEDEISENIRYNYVWIPRFQRYYSIESFSSRGGLVVIKCKVDALKSWYNDIINSKQVIGRISDKSLSNQYLPDTEMPIESRSNHIITTFGKKVADINCVHVILETAGKGGTFA